MLDPSGNVKAWIGGACADTIVLTHPKIDMNMYVISNPPYMNQCAIVSCVMCDIVFGINISNIEFGEGNDVWVTGLGHVWKLKRL